MGELQYSYCYANMNYINFLKRFKIKENELPSAYNLHSSTQLFGNNFFLVSYQLELTTNATRKFISSSEKYNNGEFVFNSDIFLRL